MPIDDPNAPTWRKLVPFETPISAGDLNSIAGAVMRLVNINASAPLFIRKDSAGITLGLHPGLVGGEFFPAKITGSQLRTGAPENQWAYSWEEVALKESTGTWETKTGGRNSGLTDAQFTKPAVNGLESPNDGSGVEGVGISLTGLLACSKLLPIADGAVVPMALLPLFTPDLGIAGGGLPAGGDDRAGNKPKQGQPTHWFAIPNALDPRCVCDPGPPIMCPDDQGGCSPPGGATATSGGGSFRATGGLAVDVAGSTISLRLGAGLGYDAESDTATVDAVSPLGLHSVTGKLALIARAKGDLFVGAASERSTRLTVGTNDEVLVADSTADEGVSYKSIDTDLGAIKGPSAAVDNSIPTYNGTTGKLLQDQGGWLISDLDVMTAGGALNMNTKGLNTVESIAMTSTATIGGVKNINAAAASTVLGKKATGDLTDLDMDELRALMGFVSRTKTTDKTLNNVSVMQADNHITGMTLPVGTYSIFGNLDLWSGTTPDIKIQWTFSGTATINLGIYLGVPLTTILSDQEFWTAFSSARALTTQSGALHHFGQMLGTITVTVAGDLGMEWAQNTANVSNTTIFTGSFLTCIKQ